MTSKEYVENALKTENTDFNEIRNRLKDEKFLRMLHAAMGIADEAGEITKVLKAALFYGKPVDITNIVEELGDLNWYCAQMSDAIGISFEEIREKNIAKLRARYGDKFSEEKANERDLKKENEALEEK